MNVLAHGAGHGPRCKPQGSHRRTEEWGLDQPALWFIYTHGPRKWVSTNIDPGWIRTLPPPYNQGVVRGLQTLKIPAHHEGFRIPGPPRKALKARKPRRHLPFHFRSSCTSVTSRPKRKVDGTRNQPPRPQTPKVRTGSDLIRIIHWIVDLALRPCVLNLDPAPHSNHTHPALMAGRESPRSANVPSTCTQSSSVVEYRYQRPCES